MEIKMSDLFSTVKALPTVDVVTAFRPDLELKQDGAGRHKTPCPFHDENTASFTVYPNGFKCYGCGAFGSNIDLLLMSNLASSPLEAAKMIAERFGISVEERKPRREKPLTLAQYASYVKVPQDFLYKSFHIEETPKGIGFPYQDESGNQIGVQLRHRLEKGKGKDNRFSWNGKPYLYGAWYIPKWKEKGIKRLVIFEGASDVQVCWFNGIPSLGVPGASNFKSEWSSVLLSFSEIAIIQELDKAGEGFVKDIVSKLKGADYQGQVKAVCLPEKDARDLWLKYGEKFKDELEAAIANTPAIDLYPQIPLTSDLILKVSELLSRHIFFKDKRLPLLIATWILGTYLYELFTFYGYLWINSPVKRCGKSLLEGVLSHLCYKATPRLSNASEASIFRLADQGGTLIFDELENLRGQDRDKYGMVMSILNNGFEAGGKVPRVEKADGDFQVIYFDTYCPKILAGINRLADTIEDRSFKIPMVRKTSSEKVERFNLRKQKQELATLKEEMGLWAEARRADIEALYDGMDEIDQLAGLDDRLKDISEPLAVIASYADVEAANGQLRILSDLTSLLLDMAGKRNETERREAIVAFALLAEEVLGPENEVFIPSGDLLGKAKEVEELSWLESTKAMGTFLGKFDLTSTKRKVNPEEKQVRGYAITRGWIEETKGRYSAEEFGLIPLSPPIKVSQVSLDQSGSEPELDFGSVPREV